MACASFRGNVGCKVLASAATLPINTHMESRVVIRLLEAAGWHLVRVTGSHHHFRHPDRPGTTTIAHPVKDIPPGTLRSIERQSGVNLRKD